MSEPAEYFGVRPNAPVKLGHFQLFETNVFAPRAPSTAQVLRQDFDSPEGGESPDKPGPWSALERPFEVKSEEDLAREEQERVKEEAKQIRMEALQEAEALRSEARRRTEETEETCRKLVEDARRQTEEIEAAAYQAGFEQGEEAGRKLGEQKVELVLKSLHSVIEAAVSQRDALMKASEQDLVKTAFLVALQLIHREIRQDSSVVLDMVRAALAKVRKASRITVQVSPQDFQFLEEHTEHMRSLEAEGMKVQLEPSEDVGKGGCRILSDVGEVDARIETILDAFRRQIWEEQ